jgi:hypothetical protein
MKKALSGWCSSKGRAIRFVKPAGVLSKMQARFLSPACLFRNLDLPSSFAQSKMDSTVTVSALERFLRPLPRLVNRRRLDQIANWHAPVVLPIHWSRSDHENIKECFRALYPALSAWASKPQPLRLLPRAASVGASAEWPGQPSPQ